MTEVEALRAKVKELEDEVVEWKRRLAVARAAHGNELMVANALVTDLRGERDRAMTRATAWKEALELAVAQENHLLAEIVDAIDEDDAPAGESALDRVHRLLVEAKA
jgi:hypothetical protein